MFADDLKLYSSFLDSNPHFSIHLVSAWASTWQLPINHSKSQHLHLGPITQFPPYEIGGYKIPQLETNTDLGTITTSKLKYNGHIASNSYKVHSRACIILRSFYSHNHTLLRRAFISFVCPILEYASHVWNPFTYKSINDCEHVQRHFTSRIPAFKHLSYSARLALLNLDSLEIRRRRLDIIL